MLHIRSIDRAHIIYHSIKYDTTISSPYPMRPTHCLCLVGQKCRGRKMGMHSPHAFFICNTITSTRGSLLLPPNHMYTQCNHSRQKKSCGRGPFSPFPNNHLECILATCCYQVLAQAASLARQPYAPTTLFFSFRPLPSATAPYPRRTDTPASGANGYTMLQRYQCY